MSRPNPNCVPGRGKYLPGRRGIWPGSGCREPRSGTEAALTLGVGTDRTEEVDAAAVWPGSLAELELAVRPLPEEEAAEALLPRGTDHQVRVGLALGVEVLGDVLDVEDLGELLDRGALGGVVLEQGADGVGDLAAAAVPHGDVDQDPLDV